jgi:cyclopropane-fatty-acyl-phospholipid synthase
MAENFFSGGQMPSDDLLLHFQRDLALEDHWIVPGTHYERTCNEWLKKMDQHVAAVLQVLEKVYGSKEEAYRRYIDWRLFFLSCAELFGYNNGQEWVVSHYRFAKKSESV